MKVQKFMVTINYLKLSRSIEWFQNVATARPFDMNINL